MKFSEKYLTITILAFAITALTTFTLGAETLYYGIEQNGQLCGYSISNVSDTTIDGRPATLLDEMTFFKMTAMGAEVETHVNVVFYIDPETGQYFHADFKIKQGTVDLGTTVDIVGERARFTSNDGNEATEIELPPDVLLENTQLFPHLLRDFVDSGLQKKTYKTLSVIDMEVHDMDFERVGEEDIRLAGKEFKALCVNSIDLKTGVKVKRWVDLASGDALVMETAFRKIFLADSTVKDNIVSSSIDENLFAKVGVSISDINGISYMKVKALLEPGGEWITPASLNFPGQKFDGTVDQNLIDGVFELTYEKYDGAGAPPFPPDFTDRDDLGKYLKAEDLIESDDPVLVEKAREITDGSQDSWEAFKRLASWVDKEIVYGIPGGGTARGAYDMQMGECGAHSRLVAAFSRAVGIPCRVVWGCMYVPNLGGSFGQHAWNEVYMGEAGWLPIDATASEIDYVDCSHIRLGEASSKTIFFNPKEMSILDYTVAGAAASEGGDGEIPERYRPYPGQYQGPQNVMTVLFQDGGLALDIPGKMKFALNDPDESGLWVFKLTDAAGVTFEENESGEISGLTLISKTKIPRKVETEAADKPGDVPDKYLPYLGKYTVPMRNFDLTVFFKDGNLAVDDPNAGIIRLKGPGDDGKWIDQFDRNKVSFDLNEAGKATAMIFHQMIKAPRLASGENE